MNNNRVMPSPSANLYERSMSALLSTFKGQIEKEQGATVEPIPKIDYIVGNFLDNLGVVQSTEQPKQNYGEEMLMLNNYMDNKVKNLLVPLHPSLLMLRLLFAMKFHLQTMNLFKLLEQTRLILKIVRMHIIK
jgi:hypothetical protein